MKRYMIALLAIWLSSPLAAQDVDLNALPGYVDFGVLSDAYGEPRVMINISGFLLQFMAAASKQDPGAAELMRNLKGVRVNVYNTEGLMTPALERIASVKAALQKSNWQPVVQVNEPAKEVQIFMQANDSGMQGLAVMTANAEEAVFINIQGEIDPSQLSRMMNQMNVNVDIDNDTGQR